MSNDWPALYSAALLGTSRAGAPPPMPPELQPWTEEASADAAWLAAVAWRAQRRRSGPAPLPPAERVSPDELADPLPPAGPVATDLLSRLLAGDKADEPFLREWLLACAENGRRVPDALLPDLLAAAKKYTFSSLDTLAEPVLGRRGRWLRDLNPTWRSTSRRTPVTEDWETGDKSERLSWFFAERKQDPAAARARAEAAWKGEPAEFRLSLLREMGTGLSPDDEPFLETRLGDRSRDVRRAAAELLATLPGSALVARQTARADALTTFKPGGLLSRPKLKFELPPEKADPAWERDATGLFAVRGTGVRGLAQMETFAAVPPSHWQERLSPLTPAEIIAAAQRSEDSAPVVTSWLIAAARFRDATWARALLPIVGSQLPSEASGIERLVDEEERARLFAARLASAGGDKVQIPEQWMLGFDRRWPMSLARPFLDLLVRRAGQLESFLESYSYRPTRPAEVACLMPPALLDEAVSAMARHAENDYSKWSERFTLAREIHAAWRADSASA